MLQLLLICLFDIILFTNALALGPQDENLDKQVFGYFETPSPIFDATQDFDEHISQGRWYRQNKLVRNPRSIPGEEREYDVTVNMIPNKTEMGCPEQDELKIKYYFQQYSDDKQI